MLMNGTEVGLSAAHLLLMRFRYKSARRSQGSPVRVQFQYPIHQPTLNKGSQAEFALARTLFLAFSRIRHRPTTRGAARRIAAARPLNFGSVPRYAKVAD